MESLKDIQAKSKELNQLNNKMSLLLRDPFLRELNDVFVDPFSLQLHRHRHPIRVHRSQVPSRRVNDDLLPSFDQTLYQLQNVMDDVNAAIGQYQSGLGADLVSGGMRTTRTEDGNLQMAMDVSQYKPEEINVRLCDDKLVVEAKTESSENDSYHKSEFKRWLKLPADCKHEAIKSTLTPDRKLLIEVPMLKPIADNRSRTIPIDIQQKPAVESGQDGDKKKQDETNKQ